MYVVHVLSPTETVSALRTGSRETPVTKHVEYVGRHILTSSSAIAERPCCGRGGVSFGKNISAKIVHLISLYPTALASTNHH